MTELELAVKNWEEAKFKEGLYKQARLSAEEDIARLKNLEKGVNDVYGLKVTVADKEEFIDVPADLLDRYFTKTISFKPNAKEIKRIQKEEPDEWKELQKCQIITPKKNSFRKG